MSELKKLSILFALCLILAMTGILSGCDILKQEYSEELQAKGTVLSVKHEDAHSEYGIGINGKPGLVTVDESFEVKINWEHGPTVLDTEADYEKFLDYKDMEVIVYYIEIYSAFYDKDTGELKNRYILDYQINDIKVNY